MEDHDPRDLGLGFWLRRVRNPRLTWGQISVYAKHIAVLQHIASSHSVALVLEDDAAWDEGFKTKITAYLAELPAAWNLIFLGASCGLELSADPDKKLFGRSFSTRSMSGYLVTPEAAGQLALALESRPIKQPIDLAVNEVIKDLDLHVYWSVPAVIENGSERGRYPRAMTGGRWRALNPLRFLRRL